MAQIDPMSRLEHRLGRLFWAGLASSAASLLCGLVLYLMAPQIVIGSRLLNVGLVILMATPLLRVIVSIAEYVEMREWFFVLTTLAVLLELSITMLYAFGLR
jgi:Protein of unknown function (DUF1634)